MWIGLPTPPVSDRGEPLVDRDLGRVAGERQPARDHRDGAQRGARVLQADERHGVADEAAAGRAGSHLLLVQRHRLHDARELAEHGDLVRCEPGAGIDANIERRGARLLRLRLLGLDGQPLDADLDREHDRDAERDRDRSERAAERPRAHGAQRQQPDLAHRSSLVSLATRTPGSGIASGRLCRRGSAPPRRRPHRHA